MIGAIVFWSFISSIGGYVIGGMRVQYYANQVIKELEGRIEAQEIELAYHAEYNYGGHHAAFDGQA